MIDRYLVKEIAEIWSDRSRFETYLKVEVAAMKALENEGIVEANNHKHFLDLKIDPKRIEEIEKTTHHDVIAFCESITEQIQDEKISRFFHFGLTSSDVIDTSMNLLIKASLHLIKNDIEKLENTLSQHVQKVKSILCIGRSHGIYAEPMSMGQKFQSFVAELKRRKTELHDIMNGLTGQLSGPVGSFTILTPQIEKNAITALGLKVDPCSSQVISRDQVAKVISWGALMASFFERLSTELRLLQHSDIDEVQEGFKKGQKGSSAMPHKKNPISAENLTGISRILRSHLFVALENTNLWHERDISHSSAERLMLPDHFGLLCYALRRCNLLVENLVTNRDHIESKINLKAYSHYLTCQVLINRPDMTRKTIYEKIQKCYHQAHTEAEILQNLKETMKELDLLDHLQSWLDKSAMRNKILESFEEKLSCSH